MVGLEEKKRGRGKGIEGTSGEGQRKSQKLHNPQRRPEPRPDKSLFHFHKIYLTLIEIAVSSVPCMSLSRLYMTPTLIHFVVKTHNPQRLDGSVSSIFPNSLRMPKIWHISREICCFFMPLRMGKEKAGHDQRFSESGRSKRIEFYEHEIR
jgi:hypothetical protein